MDMECIYNQPISGSVENTCIEEVASFSKVIVALSIKDNCLNK